MATTVSLEVRDANPTKALREFLARLLTEGLAGGVLAGKHLSANGGPQGAVMPTLVTDPALLETTDPLAPSFPLNAARLVSRLTRGEGEGSLAAVLRPCEVRAFTELVKLNQGAMDNVILIGFDCYGAYPNADYPRFIASRAPDEATLAFLAAASKGLTDGEGYTLARACKACEHPAAGGADLNIGLFGVDTGQRLLITANTPRGEGLLNRLALSDTDPAHAQARESALEELIAARSEYRDTMFAETATATESLGKLGAYLSNCISCYNCRAACPVCYCKECVFLTDVFDHKPWQYMGWARKNGQLRMPTDTLFFHLTRLSHMSLSCVGCGQCSNACPNGVPVMELFRLVGDRTQRAFGYEAGRNAEEAPPLTVFREKEFAEVTGGTD
ncbi:MAG: 4Fe-4S dicluster domain-containing protein [Desulfovibrionaceae bacterium]|jgi:formate dehydrogenase subunit beta|nr:4Fe-4S dicluster domain-containing protein [Desulfovibrionaceae bacterium]